MVARVMLNGSRHVPCRSRAEAWVSGICLASGFTAEPLVLVVSRRHGAMRRKHVCRWARMQGIALPLLLARLGEKNSQRNSCGLLSHYSSLHPLYSFH